MSRRSVHRVLVVVGLGLFEVVGLHVSAEPAELPVELPLDADAVVLDLWDADVDLYVDPEAAPALRASLVGEEPGAAYLDPSSEGATLTVRRPAASEDLPARIRVDIVVGTAQEVTLEGRDLVVTVRDARSTEDLASDGEESGGDEVRDEEDRAESAEAGEGSPPSETTPGPSGPSVLRLTVESSRVDFAGTRNAVLKGKETAVWLTRTQGSYSLELDGGSAEVRAHQGDLVLEAAGSELTFHDVRGKLEPHLRGGSLDVRGGTGVFEGTAEDAVLLFDGWLGYVTLLASGTTVEARRVDQPRPWNLEGEDLAVTMERIAGPVTVRLDGGTFEAGSMDGRLAVTATNRADVGLENVTRGAELKLSEGSTVRLAGVAGNVKAELLDSELRGERIGNLVLTGARSRVDVSGVERLAGVEMTDSDLVLDLTSSIHSPSMKLLGTGRAVVRLAAPCIVRVSGTSVLGGAPVDVSGCELHLAGQPSRSAGGRFVYGDRRPVTLAVSVDEGVELSVEGVP